MQKTFTKYIIIILTAAISLILFLNFLINLHTLESRQYDTFYIKTDQMIHTLENNSMELRLLNESLDEDYLTRARAAAYVLDHQQEVSLNVSEMQYLADLLNVDELHVIDENGIIAAGSVSQYVGIDMADHKQTRAFLAILESDDPDAFLIKETQPNAAENKIMKWRHNPATPMTIFFPAFPQTGKKNCMSSTLPPERSLGTPAAPPETLTRNATVSHPWIAVQKVLTCREPTAI